MLERGYLALIIIALLISWSLWIAVLLFVGPEDLGIIGAALFLISLGAAIFTSFLLILYYLRINFFKLGPVFRQFNIIFRESFLVSFMLIGSLLLAHYNWMNFFYFLLMIVFIIIVDVFFIFTYDKRRYKKIK